MGWGVVTMAGKNKEQEARGSIEEKTKTKEEGETIEFIYGI